MPAGRPPSPYLPEYHTRTHTTATITTFSLPLSTHDPSLRVQTCLQSVCNVFGWHPKPLSLPSLSLGLVQVPGSAASEPAAAGRAGGRRRWREPGRAAAGLCGAPGGPGDRGQHAGGGLRGRWRIGRRRRAPGPLAHSLTPAPSRSATLPSLGERVLLPGAPEEEGGFRPLPTTRHPPAPPRTGVRLGKVGEEGSSRGQVPDAARAPPRPSPRPAPAPGARDAPVPGTAGGGRPGSLAGFPYPLEMRRPPPASCCRGKGFPRLSFSGSLSTPSTSPGVEEERNGRERREGDALPRLLTFAWDFHRPADLSGQNLS
uniref:Uncharacterized protein n=1 Tax=Rangifer tarandus platyrhynchus TaxID=3082113 RepID=A0ACB0F535_RANTA|nr:unnamed protein product [Rangifer tarandus platyrhynchus]